MGCWVSSTNTVPSIPQLIQCVPLSVNNCMRLLLRNLLPSGSVIVFWVAVLRICSMSFAG